MEEPARQAAPPGAADSRGLLLLGLGAGTVLLVLRTSTSYEAVDLLRFPLAWAGVLCALDGAVRLRHGRSPLDAAGWLLLGGGSVLFWDFFELANLRLRDWWYTGLSPRWWEGGLFSAASFATVLPAVRLGEELLRPPARARTVHAAPAPAQATPAAEVRRARALAALGLAALGLALGFPRFCFPLAWLFLWPLGEAALLRWPGTAPSPLSALRAGDASLLLRLLAFGVPLGLVWEGLNAGCARGWVYTVPLFEEPKLFEMPLAGYLGYPPFLLEAGALLALLDRLRAQLAARPPPPAVLLLGAALLAVVHLGCDTLGRAHTAASFSLTLAEAGAPGAGALAQEGIATPRGLARAAVREGSAALAARAGLDPAWLARLAEAAELATRTGMGLPRARALGELGAGSSAALGRAGPAELATLHQQLAARGDAVEPALLRVWWRKARAPASGPAGCCGGPQAR